MKKLAATFVLIGTLAFGANAFAQVTCDFTTTTSTPVLSWYDKTGTLYDFSSSISPWEVVNTSTIGTPTGNPYVLHTNGLPGKSPQWLTSQALPTYNWQYNQLQWTFWFGRRANNGQNGGNQDGNIVWLYVNQRTGLDNVGNMFLEGIKVSWHHDGNVDAIRLSEVHGGNEYVLGDVLLLANLQDYEWGTTVKVLRIPGGYPTGSNVRYQLWLSTPDTSHVDFLTSNAGADTDPAAASQFLRIDTTLTSPWTPNALNTYLGVHSYYASARRDAHEYNQLCVTDLGPTPVELTSFTANYREDAVRLNWNTATEINSLGFEIQRSVEHRGEWETVAFVDGQGYSNSPVNYSYTDRTNFNGASTVAYRLKQVDRDGSFEYSHTILVTIAPESADMLYNFPNPFNPTTNISFTLNAADNVSLAVYNTAGEMVGELYNNASLSAGFHTASFNGTGLPSGRYFYRLTTSEGTTTNSMVLSK